MALQEDPEKCHWQTLTSFLPGEKVILRTSAAGDLSAGDTVTVEGFTIDHAGLRILRNGALIVLPLETAENIWAEHC